MASSSKGGFVVLWLLPLLRVGVFLLSGGTQAWGRDTPSAVLPLGSWAIGELDVVDAGLYFACSCEHRYTLAAGSEAGIFGVNS